MNLAQQLWAENADLARQALAHPFVQGIARGTLPRPLFQHYIAQDAFFLDAFARAYALGLARCPDGEGMRDFFELLSGVIEEMRLHEGYAREWGITLAAVEPHPATQAYTDFLLVTAALHDTGTICAAMTPCMRLYAYLGQQLAGAGQDDGNPYAAWIAAYACAGFEALASRLEHLLDRYAADTPDVRAAYRRAMRLEVAFFDAQLARDGTELAAAH